MASVNRGVFGQGYYGQAPYCCEYCGDLYCEKDRMGHSIMQIAVRDFMIRPIRYNAVFEIVDWKRHLPRKGKRLRIPRMTDLTDDK